MSASLIGTSTHGKLHKRGNSASSVGPPMSPLSTHSVDVASFSFHHAQRTPGSTPVSATTPYSNPWADASMPPPATTAKGLKIKPYLRKLSTKDTNAIDLSRPAAENEGLAGLGLNDPYIPPGYRTVAEVPFAPVSRPQRHRRSTSNTSQFSSSSSVHRPTQPYKHPMRQTPRPYTPPIGQSYPNSMLESEGDVAAEADDIMSDEEFRYRQHVFDPSRRSGSVSSATGPTAPPVLSLHTTNSLTKLGSVASHSQTSLPLAGSPIVPSNTVRSFESATAGSPSRASFDRAFSFLRVGTGRDSPIDPATRAREIQAARIAYREREEAKERKAEKEALKAADRESRRKTRREGRDRHRDDLIQNDSSTSHQSLTQRRRGSDAHSRSASISNEKIERPSVGGREYSDYAPAHKMSMPMRVDTASAKRTEATPGVSKTKAARSTWLSFITWFRTRLLRLGRKMGK